MKNAIVVSAVWLLAATSAFGQGTNAGGSLEGKASAKAEGCWPSTSKDVQECKAGCNKSAQSYETCKSNCEVMSRNCKRKAGEAAEQTRQ
jgi:hypothetical protein